MTEIDRAPSGAAKGAMLVRLAMKVATAIGGWPLGPAAVYRGLPSLDDDLPPVFRDPFAPWTISRAVIADFHAGVRLLRG